MSEDSLAKLEEATAILQSKIDSFDLQQETDKPLLARLDSLKNLGLVHYKNDPTSNIVTLQLSFKLDKDDTDKCNSVLDCLEQAVHINTPSA